MIIDPIFLKGYMSLVAYIHNYEPGILRPRRIRHEVKLVDLREALEFSFYKTWLLKSTRRWLQKGEMPYPGYCRSPGSGKCLPVLCNCEKLAELWKRMKNASTNPPSDDLTDSPWFNTYDKQPHHSIRSVLVGELN